jgi:hypothetical protein
MFDTGELQGQTGQTANEYTSQQPHGDVCMSLVWGESAS